MAYSDLAETVQQAAPSQQVRAIRRTLVLQIVALGLAALAIPLYLAFGQLQNEVAQIGRELMEVQAHLAALNTPSSEVQQLTEQVAQTEALVSALVAAPPPVGMNWPQLASAIGSYDRQQITLVALTEVDNRLTLEGRATDNAAVVAYIQSLAASPLFLNIERQSVERVSAPGSAPTAVSEPGAELRPVRFVLNLVVSRQ